MIEIEKPRIDCEQLAEDGSYGKFVVEPLERGYGTTLGNALRRIMLSSLPGTAPTTIKIAGVQHWGATVRQHGNSYDEAYAFARELAEHIRLEDEVLFPLFCHSAAAGARTALIP